MTGAFLYNAKALQNEVLFLLGEIMRAYYGTKISENMTETPEGYLICLNVPIGRTGMQEYAIDELCGEIAKEFPGQIVNVYRIEDELFTEASLASFENKPVTDDHPPEEVCPENFKEFGMGVVTNVRRGVGDESDCMLADLTLYDADLIREVMNGKREVSCGYDCSVTEKDGKIIQSKIIGNHVAVVRKGRAGNRVAIKDSNERKGEQMAKVGLLAKMFGWLAKEADSDTMESVMKNVFLKDSEPEEIEKEKESVEETKEDVLAEEVKTKDSDLDAVLQDILERLTRLEGKGQDKPDALDELSKELQEEQKEEKAEDSGDSEEAVTIPAEDIDEESEVQELNDSAEMINLIKMMKPIICSLPEEERIKITDTMAKVLRAKRGTPKQKASYGDLLHRTTINDKEKTGSLEESCRKHHPKYNKEVRN